MLSYMYQVQHAALFVDPRIGKTLPVCMRIKQFWPPIGFCLIAGPYSCLYGWETTLRSIGEEDVVYLIGKRAKRLERLQNRTRWCLINKEGWDYLREIADVKWDAVVVDESTFLKNPRSKVSSFFVREFRDARFRAVLSGTPAPESELEYYQQLRFLDRTLIHEDNYYRWRDRHFVQSARSRRWYIQSAYREALGHVLARSCLFIKRSDLRSNEKVYLVRKVPMPPKLRERYRTVEEEFVLEVPELGEEKRTIWPMQRYIWLRNLCAGVVDGKLLWDRKIRDLIEYLDTELHGQKAVVWCSFIQEIRVITRLLGSRSAPIYSGVSPAQRESIRRDFQQDKLQWIVAQPETFRHGTDLSAADSAHYFSTPTGLETRQQTEDRLINLDLERVALYVDWVVEDSVEESILESLRRKERSNAMMLRIVRDARRRVHGTTVHS